MGEMVLLVTCTRVRMAFAGSCSHDFRWFMLARVRDTPMRWIPRTRASLSLRPGSGHTHAVDPTRQGLFAAALVRDTPTRWIPCTRVFLVAALVWDTPTRWIPVFWDTPTRWIPLRGGAMVGLSQVGSFNPGWIVTHPQLACSHLVALGCHLPEHQLRSLARVAFVAVS